MHTHTVSSPLDVRGAGTFIGSLLSVTANPFSHRFFGQQVTELPPIIAWLLLCHKYNSEGLPFLGPYRAAMAAQPLYCELLRKRERDSSHFCSDRES